VPSSPSGGLRRSLGVVDGVALAASSTAATTSIAIGSGAIATAVGLHAPVLLAVGVPGADGLALLALGLVTAAVARYGRRSPYFTTGSGTEAEALMLPMDRADATAV
jgi:hypothetical protein